MVAKPPSTFIFWALRAVDATKAAPPARKARRESETFSCAGASHWHEEVHLEDL
jgi:hypothetical protein